MKDAVRKAVAAITGLILALVLLTALLITGFYLLAQAAILSLSPYLGEAGAMAVVGSGCIALLAGFFWRMTARNSPGTGAGTTPAIDKLREFIRENPLESALTAFTVGVANRSDLPALLTKQFAYWAKVDDMIAQRFGDHQDGGGNNQPDRSPEPAPKQQANEDHDSVEARDIAG